MLFTERANFSSVSDGTEGGELWVKAFNARGG